MNLNEYMGHLSYINKFANYAKNNLNATDMIRYSGGSRTYKSQQQYTVWYSSVLAIINYDL